MTERLYLQQVLEPVRFLH